MREKYFFDTLKSVMGFPLNELVDCDDNVYGLTSAVIYRSIQLIRLQQEFLSLEERRKEEKVVAQALREILGKTVQYQLE